MLPRSYATSKVPPCTKVTPATSSGGDLEEVALNDVNGLEVDLGALLERSDFTTPDPRRIAVVPEALDVSLEDLAHTRTLEFRSLLELCAVAPSSRTQAHNSRRIEAL
eukprot:CAMPEP_0180764986 /NCGR_PEP_ID=MMETSP1038_2-20121128/38740_1 /TAXON_ID=632150 /ORGANISM="Azadinium spinosum, Strain 3D9" /LENGTH=107 /DNA_ID=CAMNT_0022799439 /DNA_START=351 /DNA_END=673 /DNA_ORIENTATION=-